MSQIVGYCPICLRVIDAAEEHYVDSGKDYHTPCWIKFVGIKIARLERKLERKDITLEEAAELKEYTELLFKEIKDLNTPKKLPKHNFCSNSPNLITRPETRQQFSRSAIKEAMERSEQRRLQRRKLESIGDQNTLEVRK